MKIEQGGGLKSAASDGISVGQEQAWRTKTEWQAMASNLEF